MNIRRPLLALLLVTTSPAMVFAQSAYPTRPLRLVVPNPPGGTTDTLARLFAPRLAERLGQPMLVENRSGSNGNIATEIVARASADGHLILLGADAQIAVSPHVYKMAVDPVKDLTPIAALSTTRMILTVNSMVPARNFPEFLDYVKRANPPIAYASIGSGSLHHLAMEILKQRAGINMLHVPFKGGGPATIAVLAGEVPVMFGGNSTAAHTRSGKLRAIAAMSKTRSPLFPDVPTLNEFYPGLEVSTWIGLFVASGTAPSIVTRLHHEVNQLLADADLRERIRTAGGMEPLALGQDEFAALVRADYVKYAAVVKAVGVTVD